jgi:hypothetical protein
MWAMLISVGASMFISAFTPLGFVGGALVCCGVYFFLIKVLNFKEV